MRPARVVGLMPVACLVGGVAGQGRAWAGAGGRGLRGAANSDLATDRLETAAYCLRATDHAAIHDVRREELGCLPVLQGLSRVDLKAAGWTAQSFGAP